MHAPHSGPVKLILNAQAAALSQPARGAAAASSGSCHCLVCAGHTSARDLSRSSTALMKEPSSGLQYGAWRHSLHLLLTRSCSQKMPPWHCLHRLLRRLCSHICYPPFSLLAVATLVGADARPPHSLHCLLWRSCLNMLDSRHSLHRLVVWLCSHICNPSFLALALAALVGADARPPHSLHWLIWRLCSHMLDPPQSLHVLFWRLRGQMLDPMLVRTSFLDHNDGQNLLHTPAAVLQHLEGQDVLEQHAVLTLRASVEQLARYLATRTSKADSPRTKPCSQSLPARKHSMS